MHLKYFQCCYCFILFVPVDQHWLSEWIFHHCYFQFQSIVFPFFIRSFFSPYFCFATTRFIQFCKFRKMKANNKLKIAAIKHTICIVRSFLLYGCGSKFGMHVFVDSMFTMKSLFVLRALLKKSKKKKQFVFCVCFAFTSVILFLPCTS